MKKVKNISVGFLISFLGSIPIGYLNLVGLEIYTKSGLHNLVFFLFGVVFVETFVIYFTLFFARQLVKNRKLMKIIDLFSVVFMFVLASFFYLNFNQTTKSNDYLNEYLMYSPFVIGIILNCFNFLQLPFWTSWNLLLLNGKYITIEKKFKYYYITGTSIGAFLGMFSFVLVIESIFQKAKFLQLIFINAIPLFFILLGIFKALKIFRTNYKIRDSNY